MDFSSGLGIAVGADIFLIYFQEKNSGS